jgi:hypothetical protein
VVGHELLIDDADIDHHALGGEKAQGHDEECD